MATKTRKIENTDARTDVRANEARGDTPLYDASITRVMGWPVEVWLRCQAGMLKAAEPVATGWIERRREAASAAFDAFEKLAGCSNLQEVASIQRDWLEGAMRRLDTDLHAFADHAVALSHEAMSATRYAAETSKEVVGLVTQTPVRHEEPIEQAA